MTPTDVHAERQSLTALQPVEICQNINWSNGAREVDVNDQDVDDDDYDVYTVVLLTVVHHKTVDPSLTVVHRQNVGIEIQQIFLLQ